MTPPKTCLPPITPLTYFLPSVAMKLIGQLAGLACANAAADTAVPPTISLDFTELEQWGTKGTNFSAAASVCDTDVPAPSTYVSSESHAGVSDTIHGPDHPVTANHIGGAWA